MFQYMVAELFDTNSRDTASSIPSRGQELKYVHVQYVAVLL
jgi:hypothetical protein